MAKSGLKHIDVGPELTKTEWESEESHELIHGSSFPGSPVERQLFYRDDEHKWYIYDGTGWVWLGGGGGGGMQVHGNEYHDPDFATETALSFHAALTNPHSATPDATPGRLILRDANARAKVAAPSASDDIARKAEVDAKPSTFLQLTDTPSSYSGQSSKLVMVKTAEDGLEFGTPSGGGGSKIQDADADTKVDVEESADEDQVRMKVAGTEAFLLYNNGILTFAKQSKARAYLSAQQTIPNTTWTKVNLNTESFDEQNEFANYKFTASKAGAYLLIGKIVYWYADVLAAKMYAANIYKNGAGFSDMWMQSAISAKALIVLVVDVARLVANDYIELYAYHETGANCKINNGESQTSLTVFKVA